MSAEGAAILSLSKTKILTMLLIMTIKKKVKKRSIQPDILIPPNLFHDHPLPIQRPTMRVNSIQ